MSDLEKFLQQAAERLRERLQEQQRSQPPPPRPVRQAERSTFRYEEVEDEEDDLVEAELSERRKTPLPDRSERFGSVAARRPPVTDNVDQADERMSDHLHQAFDHALGQINPRQVVQVNTATAARDQSQTGRSSEVQRSEELVSPLISILRHSSSLRAAFIVSEIFKRKF